MSSSLRYMPQLDGLRTLAVFAVVYSHYVPGKYHFGFPFGSAGVQLFFVLSGFLITSILLKSREKSLNESLKSFYIRRFFRIFPLYYLVLVLCAITQIETVNQDAEWHWLYLSNIKFFLDNAWPGTGSHFWSLSVEEQFYLAWPFLILMSPAKNLKKIIFTSMIIGVFFWAIKPLLFSNYILYSVLPFFNLDSLGAGALLAFTRHTNRPLPKQHSTLIWAVIPAFVVFAISAAANLLELSHVLIHSRRVAMIVFFVWLISRASQGFTAPLAKSLLTNKIVLYLGKVSYGIYVWHSFIPVFKSKLFTSLNISTDWVSFGISGALFHTLLTVVVATLSWELFERPINKLKNRF